MKRLFVIQDHYASNHHWDLRFEAEGEVDTYLGMRGDTPEPKDRGEKVLRSFAVPKHRLPAKGERLLAVPTEDHPWGYKDFEGVIPDGYGAGEVKLIHSDYIEVSRFEQDKISFHYDGGKFAMFQLKGKEQWLITRVT